MASQGRRGSLPPSGGDGILVRVSNAVSQSSIISQGKRIASDTASVTKKLLRSTGKAAWIAGTTFVILIVPLIIEMDREQQFNEMELQQASLLGTPPVAHQKEECLDSSFVDDMPVKDIRAWKTIRICRGWGDVIVGYFGPCEVENAVKPFELMPTQDATM
ncbi:Mitochondrial import receptor subunit Tom22 [Dillenia turbinata]|uniref:Mitochondrial import receptor subunit Tom22 n=1 Tax=Dillenia turbinata TaxID=194707 RepID=A0AAN8UC43_9MAGN